MATRVPTAPRAGVGAVASTRKAAIMSPTVDTLTIGGLFIGIAGYALLGQVASPSQRTGAMLLTGILINAPHFMISYRLLYGSSERWRAYFNAAVIVPALLISWTIVGVLLYAQYPAILEALFAAAGLLLSWHWTGQTWGMISVYSTLDNRMINTLERRLLRANLYTLMVWHIVWVSVIVAKFFAAADSNSLVLFLDSQGAQVLYQRMSVVGACSSVLGLAGYTLFWRRTGKLPTVRMVVPWVSLHLGYVWLYVDPAAFFWVQNFMHALQYMIFPMRVEMNRAASEGRHQNHMMRYMLLYYVFAVVVGIVVLELIPGFVGMAAGAVGGAAQLAIVACVNLHHYFIDNAVWKLKSRHVRVGLLSHLNSYTGKAA